MAKLDLREAVRDDAGRLLGAEKGSGNVPAHSQTGNIPSHQIFDFRRDIRYDIYEFVHGAGRAVTRGEIAKGVDRKKSTWLTAAIESMVEDGILCRTAGVWKNGVVIFFYEAVQ